MVCNIILNEYEKSHTGDFSYPEIFAIAQNDNESNCDTAI